MSTAATKTIFIIDDDLLFSSLLEKNLLRSAKSLLTSAKNSDSNSQNSLTSSKGSLPNLQIYKFPNAYSAISALDETPPDLIFLDVLLPGVNGFAFLNELVSYSDTAALPVVLVSSLPLQLSDLKNYPVVGILNKETMKPEDVAAYVERY